MSAKKKIKNKPALGRGLAALIPEKKVKEAVKAEEQSTSQSKDSVLKVPVSEIFPMPGQPRTIFNEIELKELSDSMLENGILQPLLVRKFDKGYQLIAGERRWRASQLAELPTVPVIIKEVEEAEAFKIALVENIQRSNLNPVDISKALKKLADDYGWTQDTIAKQVGKNRASVANYLRILKLPKLFLDSVEAGSLSFGHAKILSGLSPLEIGKIDHHKLVAGRISVRELERMVTWMRERGQSKPKNPDHRQGESTQVRYIRKKLEQRLGLPTKLLDKGGKGKLVIEYHNLDDLEALLKMFGIGDA